MNHNRLRVPTLSFNRRRVGSVLLTAVLAGCSGPQPRVDAVPSHGPARATAESSPDGHASTTADTATGIVCDAFFAQQLPKGNHWVVGRPLVDTQKYPMDVAVTKAGELTIESRRPSEGPVTWYTLAGKKVDDPNTVHCEWSNLYPVHLKNHKGGPIWVASTNPNASSDRETWDAGALYPSGFGGAGLDYGSDMTAQGIAEIMAQATAPPR